jgi:hypothetical protein
VSLGAAPHRQACPSLTPHSAVLGLGIGVCTRYTELEFSPHRINLLALR